MSLLALVLLLFASWQLTAVTQLRQRHLQALALQSLDNMAAEVLLNQINVVAWNASNQDLLPQGEGKVFQDSIVLQWYSQTLSWQCDIPVRQNRACLSLHRP